MRSRTLRTLCVVALLVAPSTALAEPAWVLSVGPFGVLLGGAGSLQGGAGVEASILRFRNSMNHDAFIVGGVAQVAGIVRNNGGTLYSMLGAELAYGGAGLEVGPYAQSAGGGFGASMGLHAGAFLSLGVLYVTGGVHVPAVQSSAPEELGVQGFLFVGLKYPFTVQGREPYSSMFTLPTH